jgi:hypothetical protein
MILLEKMTRGVFLRLPHSVAVLAASDFQEVARRVGRARSAYSTDQEESGRCGGEEAWQRHCRPAKVSCMFD